MKKYLTPILVILISMVLLILASCSVKISSSPNDSYNDEFVSPEEFASMKQRASNDGFPFQFGVDDVKTMLWYVCPLLKITESPEEFQIKMTLMVSQEFPELNTNQLGQFAAYVANYSCLNDALALKAQVGS